MFTGIVQDIGEITAIDSSGDWVMTVATALDLSKAPQGASLAHNGICLTVIDVAPPPKNSNRAFYKVQISGATLDCTTARGWQVGTKLNLEPALRVGDELGGHYVSGHVDGAASVIETAEAGDSLRLRFEAPQEFARFIAAKGSVTIDGVSLTVNHVDGARFDVNIIPYTQTATTLGSLKVGDRVNLEIDMIARYLARMGGLA